MANNNGAEKVKKVEASVEVETGGQPISQINEQIKVAGGKVNPMELAAQGETIIRLQRETVPSNFRVADVEASFHEKILSARSGKDERRGGVFTDPGIANVIRGAEATDAFNSLDPAEQSELAKTLLEQGTVESSVATLAFLENQEGHYRNAAERSEVLSHREDKRMAEIQAKKLEAEKEAQEERQTRLSPQERRDLDSIARLKLMGVDIQGTDAETKLNEYRDKLRPTEEENVNTKLETQIKVFTNIENATAAIQNREGAYAEVKKKAIDEMWRKNLGFSMNDWVNEQKQVLARTDSKLEKITAALNVAGKVASEAVKVNRWAEFAFTLGETALMKAELSKKIARDWETKAVQQGLEASLNEIDMNEDERQLERDEGRAKYLVRITDSMTEADLAGPPQARQAFFLREANYSAQARYKEASEKIRKYQEENREFLEQGVDTVEIKKKTDREIEEKIHDEDPLLHQSHARYQKIEEALKGLTPVSGERVKWAGARDLLQEQVDGINAKLASREDEFKALKKQEKAKVSKNSAKGWVMPTDDQIRAKMDKEYQGMERERKSLEAAISQLKGHNNDEAFKILAGQMQELQAKEHEYQDKVAVERIETEVSTKLTNKEKLDKFPPEYHQAIKERDEALEVLDIVQRARENANFVVDGEKITSEAEAKIILTTLQRELDILIDPVRIETKRTEIEAARQSNKELRLHISKTLEQIKDMPEGSYDIHALVEQVHQLAENGRREVEAQYEQHQPAEVRELVALQKNKAALQARGLELSSRALAYEAKAARLKAEIAQVYGDDFLSEIEDHREVMREEMETYYVTKDLAEDMEAGKGEDQVEARRKKLADQMRSARKRLEEYKNAAGNDRERIAKQMANDLGVSYSEGFSKKVQEASEGGGAAALIKGLQNILDSIKFTV